LEGASLGDLQTTPTLALVVIVIIVHVFVFIVSITGRACGQVGGGALTQSHVG
jgi:hypothetical protein